MNHRIILQLAAVVSMLFGLALVFGPNFVMSTYRSQELSGTGMYFAMLSGAMLLGWGVMNWAASNAPDVVEIHYVLLGNLVAQSLGFLITLFRQLTSPTAVELGWINVALFLLFTLLFGYLYLASPAGYKLHATTRHA